METETNGAPAPAVNGSAAPQTAQPKIDEYQQRVMSDPTFAWDQVSKHKSENTKLFQSQQKAKPLLDVADQLGGAEQARNLIYEYDAISKHPEVRRISEHYRATGTLPTASESRPERQNSFDELFPDPAQEQIRTLQTQIAQMQQQVSQTRGAVGKQNVMGMLSQLKAEAPDGFDEYVMPALHEQFAKWEGTAQGRELLATLTLDNLKTVAGRALFENREAIYERTHARKLDELKRGATGAPAGNLSTGRETAPKATGHTSALEALREFEAREGPLMPRR